MFYNPGPQEDAGIISAESNDPFMMSMVPLELFPNEITFNTPITDDESRFNKNIVNIIFEMNDSIAVPDSYEFGEFKNGKYNWIKLKDIIGNNFDGFPSKKEGNYFASHQLELEREGNYKIRSGNPNLKIMAYGIGLNTSENYAYPLYNTYKEVYSLDSLAPKPTWTLNSNGNIEDGLITEMPNPDTLKVRSNLNIIRMNKLNSYNYKFTTNPIIVGTDSISNWSLKIIDITKEARAEIYFSDRAGNDTTIVIEYSKENADIDLKIDYEDLACSDNDYIYTFEDRDFYQFNWEITGDFTLVSSTKNERIIKWNSEQNAKIKVERINTETNKTENIELFISVKSKPEIQYSGTSGTCSFDTVSVDFAPISNYSDVKYDLRDAKGNKVFYKSINSSFEQFKFIPEVYGALKVLVTASNGSNCETVEEINIYAEINTPKVNLTYSDWKLKVDIKDAYTYYWYLDDKVIDVTSIPEFTPTEMGNYAATVIHKTSYCESPISNRINITKLGIENDESGGKKNRYFQFVGYENKTIKIKITENKLIEQYSNLYCNIKLHDISGKEVHFDINLNNNFLELKLGNELKTGVYFLNIENSNNEVETIKFISK